MGQLKEERNNPGRDPGRHLDERGQASLLIGAMVLTFSLFFAFVLNTGMLVHAKINLQNAADVAAYAGAATQARQLTDISYLNYEMRRQWKKFLFRYYVLGNFSQETHPTSPTGTRQWKPSRNSSRSFGVPAVCVSWDSRENPCQIDSIPSIPIPRGAGSDAITAALKVQLEKLELLRQGGCVSIGVTNTLLRQLWLMNTDPDLTAVLQELNALQGGPNSTAIAEFSRAVRAMAAGLGVIPRLLILRKRIKTLNEYVNLPPRSGLNFSAANELKSASGQAGSEWASLERPIQAYFSAHHTLGEHSFSDPDEVILDEILPSNGDQAQLLALKDISTEFGMYSVDMVLGKTCEEGRNQNPGPSIGASGGNNCLQCLSPINFSRSASFEPVVGVAKDPSVLTYYAIRLTAKANVLFNPFGNDITLTAYSAAQPFGSRVGPPPEMTFFSQPSRPGMTPQCFGTLCPERIPNLPMGENEPNEPTDQTGWNANDILYTYFQRIGAPAPGGGSSGAPRDITLTDMLRAYQVAMSPNPWESGKYNIPNNLSADEYVRTFSDRGIHAIWAPIVGPGESASDTGLRDTITEMLDDAARASEDPSSRSAFPPELQRSLISGMENYINQQMKNGNGEDNEGINIVRLHDPYKNWEVDSAGRPADNATAIEGLPDRFWLNPQNRGKVMTSWSEIGDTVLRERKRTGYSVKFVPLKELGAGSRLSPDGKGGSFSNRLPASNNLTRDLENLQH